ncbi:MAG: hypothetical protein ACRED2_09800, partial [Methylocella sp.]
MQANGWTTYPTVAGKTTITMLPPVNAVYNKITFNNRTYAATPGVPIEALPFDAPILQANGWTLVLFQAVTLQTLTLSAATFHVGDPQGTVVGNILGASPGSTIAFDSLSTAGALQIVGTSLQVGPTPSDTPGTVTFNLVESLTGATNTPNQTNGFSVSALVAVPVNTVVPTIAGTAQVGQTLTATTGTWTNNPASFAYQWNRAGTPIGGATASTYVPVAADVGKALTVSVVATNSSGSSAPATSAATSPVTAAVPVNTVLPAISGIAQVGQTLTATTGTWTNNPASFAYQWNRAGTPIGGATASTYVPVAADVGNALTVSVVATNSSGPSAPATSAATSAVIAPSALVFPPDTTNRSLIPMASMAVPAYLVPTTDTSLGNRVMRISDETAFGGSVSTGVGSIKMIKHHYAKTQAWNADES